MPVIDGKEALDDIRSGMSDASIMAKYDLSPVGMHRLIKKLIEVGALREIAAKDLLRDIRSGMINKDLMTKYKVSRKDLKRIFKEMTEAGICFFRERQEPREKKRIDVRRLVEDIRLGATETELMEKYGISSRGLQSAFWKIVHSGILTWDELLDTYPGVDDSVTLQKARDLVRGYPILQVKVYEKGNPQNHGTVRDLSERGIGVIGIQTKVEERKKLVLVPDEFTELRPISVEAQCKWVTPRTDGRSCSAGFEIIWIDGESSESFQELVQLMTVIFE